MGANKLSQEPFRVIPLTIPQNSARSNELCQRASTHPQVVAAHTTLLHTGFSRRHARCVLLRRYATNRADGRLEKAKQERSVRLRVRRLRCTGWLSNGTFRYRCHPCPLVVGALADFAILQKWGMLAEAGKTAALRLDYQRLQQQLSNTVHCIGCRAGVEKLVTDVASGAAAPLEVVPWNIS